MAKGTKENKSKAEMAYAVLAAAIVKDGQDANDKNFLESKWCEVLKEIVRIKLDQTNHKYTLNSEVKH